jgi:competence protein CoiA
MLYAEVDGQKQLAKTGLVGFCPGCGAPMIPKCGELKTWHWAHRAGRDCDPWSEPMGPWHLSWQEPLLPAYVEVLLPPHRADIVGKGGVVVELQHSSISTEQIRGREEFYGSMIWLFDATFRFRVVRSGELAFFAFGRTKHLDQCRKPVFLDFGRVIVQVQRFTDRFPNCSGFGYARDRHWFVREYLGGCVRDGARIIAVTSDDEPKANPWDKRCPYYAMRHPTRWIDAARGKTLLVPKGTPCMPLNWRWKSPDGDRPFFHDIIDNFPELCLGWTKSELQSMLDLLSASPVMFEGRLRVMPQADLRRVAMTTSAAKTMLALAEQHILAGRVPVLKDQTKVKILRLAQENEQQRYGKITPKKKPEQDLTLFD